MVMTMREKTILIVDDEAIVAFSEAESLKNMGYNVITASSSEAAIDVFQKAPKIDLVLMDIDLGIGPDGGITAGKILKEYDIPVIFLSNHTEKEFIQKTEGILCFGFLPKNCGKDIIAASIVSALNLNEKRVKEKGEHESIKIESEILRETAEHYRLLFETSPHPMMIYDIETLKFLAVNDSAVSKYGYNHEEFLKLTIKDIISEDEADRITDKNSHESSGLDDTGIWKHKSKNGEILIMDVKSHKLDWHGHKTEMVLAYDLTARKKQEDRVIESEKQYRTLIETSPDMIFYIDGNLYVRFVNTSAARGLKKSKEEIIDKSLNEVFPPSVAARYTEAICKVIESRISKVHEYQEMFPIGEIWIGTTLTPITDAQNNIVGVLGVARDISERKHAEEELTKALGGKETLLRELQHRVKNSFAIITSIVNLETLKQENTDTRAVLTNLRDRINSLSKLYDLLYQSQQFQYVKLKDYLEKLCRSILDIYSLANNGINLYLDIDDIIVELRHSIPLGLILNELLINSLKYAFIGNNGGTIQVYLKKTDRFISLTVADNGNGIKDGLENGRSRGLGLEIVKLLTSQLDGKLNFQGGEGSAFRIEIPLSIAIRN